MLICPPVDYDGLWQDPVEDLVPGMEPDWVWPVGNVLQASGTRIDEATPVTRDEFTRRLGAQRARLVDDRSTGRDRDPRAPCDQRPGTVGVVP